MCLVSSESTVFSSGCGFLKNLIFFFLRNKVIFIESYSERSEERERKKSVCKREPRIPQSGLRQAKKVSPAPRHVSGRTWASRDSLVVLFFFFNSYYF